MPVDLTHARVLIICYVNILRAIYGKPIRIFKLRGCCQAAITGKSPCAIASDSADDAGCIDLTNTKVIKIADIQITRTVNSNASRIFKCCCGSRSAISGITIRTSTCKITNDTCGHINFTNTLHIPVGYINIT